MSAVISERPQSVPSETWEIKVACGLELRIIISQDPECFEVEFHLGKGGNCSQSLLQPLANCLTRMRRDRNPISQIECIESFDGTPCPMSGPYARSCAQVIADVFREFWGRKKKTREELPTNLKEEWERRNEIEGVTDD